MTGAPDHRVAGQKKGLENRYVQVRFVASERLFGYFTLGSAAGSNGN